MTTSSVGIGTAERRWAALIAVATFGPYIAGGLRIEQAVLYGSLLAALVLLPRLHVTPLTAGFLATWLTLVALTTLVSFQRPPSSYEFGGLVAGLDNLLTPIAAVLLAAIWSMRGHGERRSALDSFATWVCLLLVVNSFLVVTSTFSELPWLRMFWAAGDGSTVAERSAQLGRVSGIFNQPAESGLVYSLGLILALWRWRWREYRPLQLGLVAGVLTIGGLMSVSKVFVLVGLPVFAACLAFDQGRRAQRLVGTLAVVTLAVGALSSGVIPWAGQERLQRLLTGGNASTAGLEFFTGGRLGEQSTLREVASTVLQESPLIGYGAQGLQVPYDSAWLEMLIIGGVMAVILTLAVLFSLLIRWGHGRGLASSERRLAGAVLAIAVGASFGLPALTANRGATILWVTLGLSLMSVPASRPKPDRSPQAAMAPGEGVGGGVGDGIRHVV